MVCSNDVSQEGYLFAERIKKNSYSSPPCIDHTAIENLKGWGSIEHILVRRGMGNYCNILLQKPEGKGGIGI